MKCSRTLLPGLLLSGLAAAAPYAQQTSFGTPSPAVRAAQARAGVPATWQALPPLQAGRLESAAVTVAPFNELIPSWNVTGTATSPLTVEVRVRRPDGRWTRYFSFGQWRASGPRASAPVTRTPDGTLNTDTLTLPFRADTFQYRVTPGAGTRVGLLSFNTSDTALRFRDQGQPGQAAAWNRVLKVPGLSQMIYPDGGPVWCSPTSVSMLLGFWNRPVRVPDAARATFDATYDGFGNWPFNTAYAATHGLQAFVTRLGSLRDAEAYLLQGLPLAVSLRFRAGELPGAPLSWSDGHLLVLTGFDAQGNPVVNDPAAPNNATVGRTYPRGTFERLWLGHAGGLAYVVAPQP
ncbi:C39 family peptidase [Deinococcus aestuarii]|uniref:C39 family peptidase n=1 Tax=Deinococcus aestuarii TaxID=2774531 RepID=UPI001C0E00E4